MIIDYHMAARNWKECKTKTIKRNTIQVTSLQAYISTEPPEHEGATFGESQGSTNIPKILKPLQNFRHHKSDMKQVPY